MPHGKDISNAESLYRELLSTETTIKLFLVDNADVDRRAEALSALSIGTVKGTMRFHQVITSSPLKIKCDIICACLREQGKFDCPCFKLKEVELVVNGQTAASPVDEVVADTQPTSTGSQQGATSYEVVGVFFSMMR